MTNLTLSREMQNMAERLAENAHDIWAKKKKEELNTCGGNPHDIYYAFYILLCCFDFNQVEFTRNSYHTIYSRTRRNVRTEKDPKSSLSIFNIKDTNCTSMLEELGRR